MEIMGTGDGVETMEAEGKGVEIMGTGGKGMEIIGTGTGGKMEEEGLGCGREERG